MLGYTTKDKAFWIIVSSLGLASMTTFATMYAVQPLLPLFTQEFTVSVATASLSMSVTTIALIIGLLSLGFLSDRFGRVPFIKLSLLASALPFLLMPLTESFTIILVLRFIQGFALAGVPAAALAYISEEIHPSASSIATSLYISCNALGGMLGRLAIGYITENYSWQLAFIALAFLGLLVFFIILCLLPASQNFIASTVSVSKDVTGFIYHLKNKQLLLFFGLGITLQLAFTGVWSYLPFYLSDAPFYLSLQAISLIFCAYALGIVGSPLASALADKFGMLLIQYFGIITLSIGITLTYSQHLSFVIIGLCASCLGFFSAHAITSARVSHLATYQKGSASSLYLVAYYIGVASGSTLLSPIWLNFGWTGIVLITASLPISYLLLLRYIAKKSS